MITIKDLRVGTWIQVDDLPPEQVTLETFKILAETPGHAAKFNGIQLTHDILRNAGFKQKSTREYYMGSLYIDIANKNTDLWTSVGLWYLCPIDYVHELQNLYFSLTRKELQINL